MATSAKQWKKASEGEELELPSGNTALIRRPGLPKLLAAGVIPDSLTPIAEKAVQRGKGTAVKKTEIDASELMSDPSKIAEVFETFDRITAMCVMEPKVVWHMRPSDPEDDKSPMEEIPLDERNEDIIYTDDVDIEDKMFLFQYVVGGTRDLETFRQQFRSAMAGVDDGEGVQGTSK